jgi:hypothetical protein
VPKTENIAYNTDSRIVTWNIGSMPKVNGSLGTRTVSFQVSVTPTKTQVGSELPLLSETQVAATDASANVPLSVTRPAVTTRLPTDPGYSVGKEKVTP